MSIKAASVRRRSPIGDYSSQYSGALMRHLAETAERSNQLATTQISDFKSFFVSTLTQRLSGRLQKIVDDCDLLYCALKSRQGHGNEAAGAKTIRNQACEIAALLATVEEISKLQSGTLSLVPELIHLKPIIEAGISELAEVFSQKVILFDTFLDNNLSPVLADAVRFQQAFTSVLGIIVKHADQGETVSVDARQSSSLEVSIKIELVKSSSFANASFPPLLPLAQAEMLFLCGHDTEVINLAIARSLVEAHGGTFDLKNRASDIVGIEFTLPAHNRQGVSMPRPIKTKEPV